MSRPGGLKHARRLSIFGIGSGSGDSSDQPDRWPQAAAGASNPLSMSVSSVPSAKSTDLPLRRTQTNSGLSRTSSKKLTKKAPPRPATSSVDITSGEGKEGDSVSVRKQKSLKLRVAVSLSTLFVPKPRKKNGKKDALAGLDGIGYYCKPSRDSRDNEGTEIETQYSYISRSPSPPSPNIRPPSGLGRAAESVDLAAYVREERERSLRASSLFAKSTLSRTPSHTASLAGTAASHTPSTMGHGSPQTDTPDTSVTHYLESKSTLGREEDEVTCEDATVGSICLKFPSPPPSPAVATIPRPSLVQAIRHTASYCALSDLPALARANRAFTPPTRSALYEHIDTNDLPENESDFTEFGARLDKSCRRLLLASLYDNEHLAALVKSIRWTCSPGSSAATLSPTSSISSQHRSIPRRAPIVSISASPEEQVLPRVIARLQHLKTLSLVHPPPSFLLHFLPSTASPRKSPRATPIPSPCPSPSPCSSPLPPVDAPSLPKLEELSLSGRTTVSTSFSTLLVRFLERHPDIHTLSLPDVFCLPIPVIAPRLAPSNSSHTSLSSPKRSPSHPVPPVPPLPPTLALNNLALQNRKDASGPPVLPHLTKLTAPLTLAKQLVPGRPVRVLDVEVATSVFEGLRPAEVARCFASTVFDRPRLRAVSLSLSPSLPSPASSASTPVTPTSLAESTDGDGAGKSPASLSGIGKRGFGADLAVGVGVPQGIKELRIRCSAKVDGRTVGRFLNAIGTELGTTIEMLGLGWAGNDSVCRLPLILTGKAKLTGSSFPSFVLC